MFSLANERLLSVYKPLPLSNANPSGCSPFKSDFGFELVRDPHHPKPEAIRIELQSIQISRKFILLDEKENRLPDPSKDLQTKSLAMGPSEPTKQ